MHEKVEGEMGETIPETMLSCDIQTLSAMMMGYQTPAALNRIGRLRGDKPAVQRWEALIPKRTTYLMDFF